MNNGVHEANAMASMGKITAADPSYFKKIGRYFGQVSKTGDYRAGGYTISNSNSYIPIQNALQAYVQEQPKSDATYQPVGDKTQDSVIGTARFDGDGGIVNVKVYGASTNNIYNP